MARRGKTSIMMPRSNRRKAPPSRDAASKSSTAQKAGKRKSAAAVQPSPKGKMQKSPGRTSSPAKSFPAKSSPTKASPKRGAIAKAAAAAKLPSPPKSLPLKGKKAKADTVFTSSSPSPAKLALKGRQDGNSTQSPRRPKPSAATLTPVALRKKEDNSLQTPSPARPSPMKKRHATATTAARDGVNTADIIEGLREKFQQLNMLRTTAAEALLQEYKRSAEERIGVAEKLVESLKRENEALKRRLSEQDGTNAASAGLSRRVSDVSNLTADRPDALRPIVELYRQLSGLQVSADLDSGEAGDSLTWHCLLSGRQGEFSFDLTLEEAESQYRYAPTFPERSQIASRLPAYLMEEITFDRDQIQLFFWRALNFLMTTTAGTK